MSNYPDDFQGTNMDAGHCEHCGRQDYVDENGICDDCLSRRQAEMVRNTLISSLNSSINTEELSAKAAYTRIMMDINNIKTSKEMGMI